MQFYLKRNFWIIFLLDLLFLSFCYYSAYCLRFDGSISPVIKNQIISTIVPLLFIKISAFFFFDLYRGMWRYAGIKDLINVIKASITGTVLFVVYLAVFHHFSGVSRGVLFVDAVFTIVFIGGMRLLIRLFYQRDQDFFDEIFFWRKADNQMKKVLIIGTGHLAESL
ncbi:MAG: hypothetical protein ACP5EQ_08110, partial [Candidatus Cloacimonadia bacterium]